MKNWDEVYELPLRQIDGLSWVEDAKGAFVFQFIISDQNLRENIIKVLNGEMIVKGKSSNFVYENGVIRVENNGSQLILIRGWGHLTGTGVTALGLSAKDAASVQKTFAKYIISKLNPK